MKISIYTLGCKTNQAETESLLRFLENKNVEIVPFPQKADFCILNTCRVTKRADQKSSLALNKAIKTASFIIVTGCGVEFQKERLKEKNKLNKRILFIKDKKNLIQYLKKELKTGKGEKIVTRTRAFVKIQEGCNNFCSYCIVPFVRGIPRSISPDEIISEIRNLEKMNYKEIVLVGTNIGKYKFGLENLIELILENTEIERIRLSSLNPEDISKNFISLFKKFNKEKIRLCRHLHLSLQSGSDKILKLMGRNYKKKDFEKLVHNLRKNIKDLLITTDIIVGFPQETEKDFKETLKFLEEIGFLKIHVFSFSPRPFTKAARMKNQIPEKTKKERKEAILKLAEKIKKQIYKANLNKVFPVLFEEKKDELWQGYTDNYLPVKVKENINLKNKIFPCFLKRVKKELEGELFNA